jgi:sec-independent protein translocase protein TatA
MTELLLILGIVVFLFGAKRIPEMGKGIGEGIRNFKKSMKNDDTEDTKDTKTDEPRTKEA